MVVWWNGGMRMVSGCVGDVMLRDRCRRGTRMLPQKLLGQAGSCKAVQVSVSVSASAGAIAATAMQPRGEWLQGT
jgi:hypothetical protein